MTLSWDGNGYVSQICCDGHPTPEEARTHGLGRLVELTSEVADRYIALWHEKAS